MNNVQAITKLAALQRAGHDVDELMDYIAELAAALELASRNLTMATEGSSDRVTSHNAAIVAARVEKLVA